MKKYVLLLLLAPAICPASAQDSLLNLLRNHTEEDTIKAGYYSKISRIYSSSDPQLGMLYADSCILLSAKLKSSLRLGHGYAVKAMNFSALGDDSSAVAFFDKALLEFKSSPGNEAVQAIVFHNQGICHFNQSNYLEAITCQEKSKELARKTGNREMEASALNSLGIVYMSLARVPQAMECYYASLKIIEPTKDTLQIANVLLNIGLQHKNLQNHEKALNYTQRAFDYFMALGSKEGMAHAYNNFGNIYSNLGKEERAIEVYRKALEMNKEMNAPFGIASNLTNMGISFEASGDFTGAYRNYLEALVIYRQLKDVSNESFSYQKLGDLLLHADRKFFAETGLVYATRHAKAESWLRQALKLWESLGDPAGIADACESLSELYEQTGRTREALACYKRFITCRDSVLNLDNKVAVEQKELQHDYDKKEALLKAEHDKEQALAGAESERQRFRNNSLLGGLALLALTGAGGFVSYKRRRDLEKKKLEADYQVQVTETEMKALRAQMNPHFIFNSLNSISDYMARNDLKSADDYLARFAKLMRQILENSEMKEVTLTQDLQALENYIRLESLRMKNKFTWSFIVDPSVDPDNTLVPPLLLQPFVENSIWHGLSKKTDAGTLTIRVLRESDLVNCVVEDDGVGRQAAGKNHTGISLGMKITQARIDIMNRSKKTDAGIRLSDLPRGLRVEVRIPYLPAF